MEDRMRHASLAGLVALVALGAVVVESRRAQGDDATKPIDVDVTDKDVSEVIADIAKKAGKNVAVEKGIHDKVTVQLNQVSWRDAIDFLAKRAGCKVEEQGPALVVKKVGAAVAPPAG